MQPKMDAISLKKRIKTYRWGLFFCYICNDGSSR